MAWNGSHHLQEAATPILPGNHPIAQPSQEEAPTNTNTHTSLNILVQLLKCQHFYVRDIMGTVACLLHYYGGHDSLTEATTQGGAFPMPKPHGQASNTL